MDRITLLMASPLKLFDIGSHSCKGSGLQLLIIFVMDLSVDFCFLSLINCLIYRMSKACQSQFPKIQFRLKRLDTTIDCQNCNRFSYLKDRIDGLSVPSKSIWQLRQVFPIFACY